MNIHSKRVLILSYMVQRNDMMIRDQSFAILHSSTLNKMLSLPPVALENRDLDCMTNLKMYSRERKHF